MSLLRLGARLAAAATAATIGLVATGAGWSPAAADAPTKVGWWNAASGNGQAAPAPDVPAGGLRVAVASAQEMAFGAVEIAVAKDGSGSLSLPVAQMTGSTADMLNNIRACPTKDDSWKAGDDQPMSAAPVPDCAAHAFVGQLSADGKTMTFSVDGSADVADGTLSLAIVAVHATTIPGVGTDPGTGTDLTPPFAVDFDKPAFSVEDPGTTAAGGSAAVAAAGADVPAGSAGSTPVPPATAQVDVPAATTTDTGQTPVVAGQPVPGVAAPFQPAAAAKPVGPGQNRRDLLLAMLILLLFGFLYTQNTAPRPRRALAGPRAKHAAEPPPVPYPAAPRGLGRFAKERTGPARPLI